MSTNEQEIISKKTGTIGSEIKEFVVRIKTRFQGKK